MAYDVDKELEALMKNIKEESKNESRPVERQVVYTNQQPAVNPEAQNNMDNEHYTGSVYFAKQKPTHVDEPRRRPVNQPNGNAPQQPRLQTKRKRYGGAVNNSAASKVAGFDLRTFLKKNGTKGAVIYVAVLVAISAILSIYTMSFVNDILAFHRSDESVSVTIPENATTNQVIKILKKNKLIKHKNLCKMFMSATTDLHGKKKPTYLSGVYDLKPSMGLEKMLLSCQELQKAEVVTVTIPEGFTVAQIADKLEKAGVCTSDDFYNNLEKAAFDYDFLQKIENKSARYNWIEGYLYPETYEFYVGQSASSVIRKLLDTFDEKWTDEYQAQANKMNMSLDEVLTMASIIQKEAGDADQMPTIASVFYNRLASSSFRCLQSDATTVYVARYIKPNVSVGEANTFASKYDTYKCIGLPAGPICCPGDDAINAVLYPADTNYYFFGHDASGKMYAAKTEAERNKLMYAALGDD